MGLIKSMVSSVSSELHDQWQEVIRCNDMDMDTLMIKKTTPNGVISNKSAIYVSPGQVAVILDSGEIIDATAEEGVYTFDNSSSPSFFAGQFGEVFKDIWQRFKYNGATNKEQAVYFINVKEIIGNKFGTMSPIPFQDYSHSIPNQMTGDLTPLRVEIKCFGKYTYKIVDPALFMRVYAGTADIVKKDLLNEQMRSEVLSTFQNVINELGNSENKTPVLELPSYTDEIKSKMDEKVFDQPIRNRGIEITGFSVESVTLDEESNKKIDEYEHNSNNMMQQGRVLNVMETAASNETGSVNGFMGVGVMNMVSGGMGNAVIQNAFNNNQSSEQSTFCSNCGLKNDGNNYCPKCGTKLN